MDHYWVNNDPNPHFEYSNRVDFQGKTYHEATAGLTLYDIEQEDYDYFKKH